MEKGRIEFEDPTFREYQECLERFESSDLGIFDKHFGDLPIGMRAVCAARGQQMVEEIRQQPLDLLIFCPVCHKQHIDRPDPPDSRCPTCNSPNPKRHPAMQFEGEVQPCNDSFHNGRWANPVHKSHTCRKDDGGCGNIFRLADFPTNGVKAIQTKGVDDTWEIHVQSTGD